jgi:hypothetical protein
MPEGAGVLGLSSVIAPLAGEPSRAFVEDNESAKQAKSTRHAIVPNEEVFRAGNCILFPQPAGFF